MESSQPYLVTVFDEERKGLLRQAVGGETVPVISPVSVWATLGEIGPQLVYQLKVDALQDDELERLAAGVAALHGGDVQDVLAQMRSQGMPIRAEECVCICTGLWFLE